MRRNKSINTYVQACRMYVYVNFHFAIKLKRKLLSQNKITLKTYLQIIYLILRQFEITHSKCLCLSF